MVAGAHARRESRRVLGRTSSTPRAVLSLPHRNVARQLDATNRGLGGRRGFLAIRSCTYGDNGRRVIVEDADGGDDTRPAIGGI